MAHRVRRPDRPEGSRRRRSPPSACGGPARSDGARATAAGPKNQLRRRELPAAYHCRRSVGPPSVPPLHRLRSRRGGDADGARGRRTPSLPPGVRDRKRNAWTSCTAPRERWLRPSPERRTSVCAGMTRAVRPHPTSADFRTRAECRQCTNVLTWGELVVISPAVGIAPQVLSISYGIATARRWSSISSFESARVARPARLVSPASNEGRA